MNRSIGGYPEMQALFAASHQSSEESLASGPWRVAGAPASRRHAGLLRRPLHRSPLPPGHRFPMPKYRRCATSVRPSLAGRRSDAKRRRRATANWRWRTRPRYVARSPAGPAAPAAAARDRLAVVAGDDRTCTPLGRSDAARRARGAATTALPPTWPAARTMRSADRGSGFCVFNDTAVAARADAGRGAPRAGAARCACR